MTTGTFSPISQCVGKERYDSASLAHKAAKRRCRSGKDVEAYRCAHCNGYHHGKRTRRVKKLWKKLEAVIG